MERFDKTDLQQAVQVMREGGIILYPTDTVWGIGCDATNAEAVRKIYALKQREDSKSMLCLLDGAGKLQGYVDVPDAAWQLLEVTTPEEGLEQRPMTIIYPNARNLAANLIAEDGSVGIRITTEPFSRALCEQLHHPIVSTSANISGQPTAKNFRQISDEIKLGVDYVCQFRQHDDTEKKPSVIIKVGTSNEITIIRK
ncbi:MAG: threonylcarbamoyl-AMP synthase [Paludibacteraceae bacterium]|nr:threonylcarbamoyl-AMP synthase [Paludibacteraceae bacterium]